LIVMAQEGISLSLEAIAWRVEAKDASRPLVCLARARSIQIARSLDAFV
jgi:hypothetical protein